ncbi:sensor histidine kinase [Saccharopolyspora gregorii]|uniref:sensor histidine kinase n=1 Tax=Saccharopolyspora gregorii TaxID=33914 RepID=UPI0021AD1EB4|nr:histidine kinase [Saccharopolyspora gregorii]
MSSGKRVPSPRELAARVAAEPRLVREAVRAAPRRVRLAESVCFVLLVAAGLTIQLNMPPELVPAPRPPVPVAVLSALWAAVLVPARRRWPVAVLPALVFGEAVLSMLLLPVLAFSAGRRTRSPALLWTAVLGTVVLGAAYDALLRPAVPMSGADFALTLVGSAVLLGVPAVAGQLLGTRQPLVRLLRERNDYLESVRHLTAEQARSAERADIAGEMHDMLGHRLSLLSLHAGALELSAAKKAPEVSEQAEFVRATAKEALTELRGILGVLRSGAADAGRDDSSGRRADVERLVAESRTAGMAVQLHWHGPDLDEVDPRVRHAVHRIVREALTNAHKHAPGAAVVVEVSAADPVSVRVRNAPVAAPDSPARGLRSGLAGLEERARMLGGTFTGGPGADGGFAVRAELPAHPPAAPPPEAPVRERPPVREAEVLTKPRMVGAGVLLFVLAVPMLLLVCVLVFALMFSSGGVPLP